MTTTSPDIAALTAALDEARQDVHSASAEFRASASPWDYREYRMAQTRLAAMREREEVARVALARANGRIAAAATRARRQALIAQPTLSQLHAAARPLVMAEDADPSTVSCRRALEESGIRPTSVLVEQLRQLLPARIATRRARARIQQSRPAQMPALRGTLADRLEAVRKRAVRSAALQVLRTGPRTTITVCLGADPRIVLATNTCRPYGGRWKTWSAQEQDYDITVPADWRRTVEARGLAEVAGTLTLAAMPVEARAGIEAADCLVAVPGRGYEVRTERRLYARIERGAWVHIRPQALAPTAADIRSERNTEIRTIMIAAYGGIDRYLVDAGARTIHRDETGELLRLGSGAAAITAVRLRCPTTGRVYVERVPPTMATAREAVAWQFGLRADQYQPMAQS